MFTLLSVCGHNHEEQSCLFPQKYYIMRHNDYNDDNESNKNKHCFYHTLDTKLKKHTMRDTCSQNRQNKCSVYFKCSLCFWYKPLHETNKPTNLSTHRITKKIYLREGYEDKCFTHMCTCNQMSRLKWLFTVVSGHLLLLLACGLVCRNSDLCLKHILLCSI